LEHQKVAHTARARIRTGYIFQQEENVAKGTEFFRDGYELSKSVLGENDSITIEALERLVAFEKLSGNLEEASVLAAKLVKNCYALFGKSHPFTARCLGGQGHVELVRANYDVAEKALSEASAIFVFTEREQSYDHARTLAFMAQLCNRTERFERARALSFQATSILVMEGINKGNLAMIGYSQIELARSYYGQAKYEECTTTMDRLMPMFKENETSLPSREECLEWMTFYRDALARTNRIEEAKEKDPIIEGIKDGTRRSPF
jgi:tetratricopeptide (TPR) repeat protein